jgi:hypothetical protein
MGIGSMKTLTSFSLDSLKQKKSPMLEKKEEYIFRTRRPLEMKDSCYCFVCEKFHDEYMKCKSTAKITV